MSGHGSHESHDDGKDHFGKYVGIATAAFGLCVMVTTIVGHQAHNLHISKQSEAYNTWSQYQAKKIRQANLEAQADFAEALDAEKTAKVVALYRAKAAKYSDKNAPDELPALSMTAKAQMDDAHEEHVRGDRFDLAEGMLEFGVILCSLYFLSKKKFFPALGAIAATAGLVMFGYAFFGPVPHLDGHGEPHAPAAHADADHASASH